MSSSSPRPKITLDTSDVPAWDLELVIRGVAVQTLSPLEAADRSVVNLGERRPGAVVRLWRWAFGEPRGLVGDDHETRELRRTVAAFVPETHRSILGPLSGGELMAALGKYVGAQSAWYAEIESSARAEAERIWDEARGPRLAQTAEPTVTPAPGGGRRVTPPPHRLVPGRPLPQWTHDVTDGLAGKGGNG